MIGRNVLIATTHLISTALALKVLKFILPCFITCYYTCAANFLMCIIVAKLTYGFTKRRFLSDRILPDNRAIFITGCDSGFGNGIAKQLDSRGFHVFAGCLFPDGEGAKELGKRSSKRLQIVELDVTKDESVAKAAEFVKENLGTSELWAVINNAGVQKGYSVELTGIQDFKDCLEVNTLGPVRVTKAFLPLLRQSKGRVVNVASLGGRIAQPHITPYIMSKFANVGFTACLRQEMDVWGIQAISIEPEYFETPMTDCENISKRIDESFASIDEDVRVDYGESYLKNFKIFCEFKFGISSPKVYKVLNAMELAVSLEHPDPIYRPCRNVFTRILSNLYIIAPVAVQELIAKFICYSIGFPKPKEADNNL